MRVNFNIGKIYRPEKNRFMRILLYGRNLSKTKEENLMKRIRIAKNIQELRKNADVKSVLSSLKEGRLLHPGEQRLFVESLSSAGWRFRTEEGVDWESASAKFQREKLRELVNSTDAEVEKVRESLRACLKNPKSVKDPQLRKTLENPVIADNLRRVFGLR